jgi:hypothetical protein
MSTARWAAVSKTGVPASYETLLFETTFETEKALVSGAFSSWPRRFKNARWLMLARG